MNHLLQVLYILTFLSMNSRSGGPDSRSDRSDNRSGGPDSRSSGSDNRSGGPDSRSGGLGSRSGGLKEKSNVDQHRSARELVADIACWVSMLLGWALGTGRELVSFIICVVS